jgi:predicted nuclease with RNAse H fold
MIAGFAAYRTLEAEGIEVCESFPDLQFRLAAPTVRLLPKSTGRKALAMRQRIVARLASAIGIEAAVPATVDFADAAVLALGALQAARVGALIELHNAEEGSFVLGLSRTQQLTLGGYLDSAALDKHAKDRSHRSQVGKR